MQDDGMKKGKHKTVKNTELHRKTEEDKWE
jgi:hypothetical protein